MSGATHGMNIEEVRRLGDDLARYADQLDEIARRLDRQVSTTRWEGPVARRFKGAWWPQHRTAVVRVATDLRGFGQSARNNAAEQDRVSSTAGAGGSSGGGSRDTVRPLGGDIRRYGWRIVQTAPGISTAIGITKIAWNGAVMTRANFDEAMARIQHGGNHPLTRAAEARTMAANRAVLRESIDTGVGLIPFVGHAVDLANRGDALGDLFLGTGDHSDDLSAGRWVTELGVFR